MSHGLHGAVKFGLLLLYGIAPAMRVPEVLWTGRFWAEEGAVYFRAAVEQPLWRFMMCFGTLPV